MAALQRVSPLVLQTCRRSLFIKRHISKANPLLAQWHEDWEVGKKPVTKQEHEAAAKKYGLLPEDYKPSSDKSDLSDYPELPSVGQKGLDPYTDWDDPGMCRNFGEPIHRNWEMMTEDRCDPSFQPKHSFGKMLACFLGIITFFMVAFLAAEPYRIQFPRLAKQYPWDDMKRKKVYDRVTHYTFEPVK